MAEDWAADVKKFVPDADDGVIAAIVRYCGIALRTRDASLVSFTDPAETGRVRDNFLKKKLGLTHSDEVLDQAIAAVGERMKGVNFRNRVTVYYLLLEHFGLLHLFGGAARADGGAGDEGDGGAAVAGAVAAVAAGLAGLDTAPAASPAEPSPGAGLYREDAGSETSAGLGWWSWLLLALLALILLALLWWLFLGHRGNPQVSETPVAATSGMVAGGDVGGDGMSASTETGMGAMASAATVDLATAPAEGTVTIPTGAGVTAETRDGTPVVKVYFDTGKADVVPAFAATAEGLKAYLAAHEGASLAVSGFNDSTGNAALNAELSKRRAQAVKAALVAAGIPEASAELVKPADTTDIASPDAAARRVEVVVR